MYSQIEAYVHLTSNAIWVFLGITLLHIISFIDRNSPIYPSDCFSDSNPLIHTQIWLVLNSS